MRKYNIDFIKALAIFLVICIHFHFNKQVIVDDEIQMSFYYIIRTLFSIAVPLFLIAGGYLLITKDYSYKTILKKVVQFLVLAIIYKFISLLLMGGDLNYKNIVNIFLDINVKETPNSDYRTNFLWYIYAYIGILLLQPVLHEFYKNKKKYLIFSLICIFYAFFLFYFKMHWNELVSSTKFNTIDGTFPLNTRYCYAYGFFLVGTLIRMYEDKIISFFNKYSKKTSNIVVIILLIVFLLLTSYYTLTVTNILNFTHNPVTYHYRTPFGLVFSSLIFIWLMYLVKPITNSFIQFVSKNTLGIFLLHWPVSYVIKNAAFKYDVFASIPGDIFISFIVLLICSLIVFVFQKNKLLSKLVTV